MLKGIPSIISPDLLKVLAEIDPKSFVIITTSNEIIGRGFRNE